VTSTEDSVAAGRRRFSLSDRFGAFIAERYPFAIKAAVQAFREVVPFDAADLKLDAKSIESLREPVRESLERALSALLWAPANEEAETTPGVSARERLEQAKTELLEASDGFLAREAITASLTPDEKREILRGMLLTRATDNRLKAFFTGGEIRYGDAGFQGKGFRSLGQEAIYACAIRLKRGGEFRAPDGTWRGDIVAPLIRDLGAALAMRSDAQTVRMVLNAQMGKAGPPMDGRDFHIGDLSWGILPASAPLSISSMSIAGMAMAFSMHGGDPRVAVSFIGEGGSSLGEWHEAINVCAARRLPAIFCIQNNQTALSTPVSEQSAVRVFADKAAGYGIPGITIDGTDPEAIAASFTWAAQRARAGLGPALIELIAMRMCGHAHHDDMLYVGRDPQSSWEYPQLLPQGYADPEAWAFWCERDPISNYSAALQDEGLITGEQLDAWKREIEELVEREARAVIDAPWPSASTVTTGVFAPDAETGRGDAEPSGNSMHPDETIPASPRPRVSASPRLTVEAAPPFDPGGHTFLEAVMRGVEDALRSDPRVFVYGEDVGGKYGNAFLLLRPLLKDYGHRILNSPLAEGGVLGVCIGSALAGMHPIGEMQFNDFVATGFNQLVNNAAKIRYRWGGSVPMVVRMPWGGLRHAGPYHSQNTEPWFYRTPGLKIVVPSTPHDARAMMASAVADPDPVLYYEHIALYRNPRIKQLLGTEPPEPIPLGRAALRRAGQDLVIISYGAYVHTALEVAEKLAGEGVETAVLDLRSLVPLDLQAVLELTRLCNRVIIVHEDSLTGGIGESLASKIQQVAFDYLEAPIRVIGALDTPVPYSPPLEAAFLPSETHILEAARELMAY
jgi:2-oxoisovalerate dehydrogenase E1 component